MPNAVRSRVGSSSASRREAAVERAAGGGDAAEGRAECGGACEAAVQLLRGRARASLSVQVAWLHQTKRDLMHYAVTHARPYFAPWKAVHFLFPNEEAPPLEIGYSKFCKLRPTDYYERTERHVLSCEIYEIGLMFGVALCLFKGALTAALCTVSG